MALITDKVLLNPKATASAPSSTEGGLYYDSDEDALMSYGTSWQMVSKATASGGTEWNSGGYRYHTFLTGGDFTISGGSLAVDVFMIGGGGGGGGARYGGGGGAGGLIWYPAASLTSQTCVIVIGAGGAGEGGDATILDKTNGVDTTMTRSIGNLTAKGGGWGASGDNTTTTYGLGNIGGCGGGGMNYNSGSDNFGTSNQSSQSGDSGTYGIGFSGGRGYGSANYDGGGGGGLSEAGVSATNTSGGTDGRGGHGVHTLSGLSQAQTTAFLAAGAASQSEVVSSIRYIGAGGGAGGHDPVSAIGSGNRVPGGHGFGGDGGVQGSKSAGLAAPANSGSGGGSAVTNTSSNTQPGGAGGSGIVIIRYAL